MLRGTPGCRRMRPARRGRGPFGGQKVGSRRSGVMVFELDHASWCSEIHASADADEAMAVTSVDTTGQVALTDVIADTLAPAKFPRLRIVVQQLGQPRARQSRAFFHGWSRKMKKGREAALQGDVGVGSGDVLERRGCRHKMARTRAHGGTLDFGRSHMCETTSKGVRQFGMVMTLSPWPHDHSFAGEAGPVRAAWPEVADMRCYRSLHCQPPIPEGPCRGLGRQPVAQSVTRVLL
jgi:hypothetical protein